VSRGKKKKRRGKEKKQTD